MAASLGWLFVCNSDGAFADELQNIVQLDNNSPLSIMSSAESFDSESLATHIESISLHIGIWFSTHNVPVFSKHDRHSQRTRYPVILGNHLSVCVARTDAAHDNQIPNIEFAFGME